MRKSYTSEFKAKVSLEAVKGERSLSELASKYEVTRIRLVSGGRRCFRVFRRSSQRSGTGRSRTGRQRRRGCMRRSAG